MGKPSSRGFARNVYPTARQLEIADEAKFDIGEVEKELKPLIIQLVEKAFISYLKAHGVTDEQQQRLEWQRFKKILARKL